MTPEQTTQQRLDRRGVRDVKFLFGPEGRNAYASVVLSDVEEVLEKYLDDECRIVVDFSDKELPQDICA